jgi:hypothetical protein
MTRQIRPATGRQSSRLSDAITYLKRARNGARAAGCPATLKKITSALNSAMGARRHMQRRLGR